MTKEHIEFPHEFRQNVRKKTPINNRKRDNNGILKPFLLRKKAV